MTPIGVEAYVAMGSAITKDVPADALAIGRARQENKLKYVKKLKERLARRKAQALAEKNSSKGAAGG